MYTSLRRLLSALGPVAVALGRPLPVVSQANILRRSSPISRTLVISVSTAVGAAIFVTSMGALGYSIYTRRRRPRNSRPSTQPLSKHKISAPLELGQTTDVSHLIVTYEGIGKNGEVVQVQLGVQDSLAEKQYGLIGTRSTFVDVVPVSSENDFDQIEATEVRDLTSISAGIEEDLEMPLNSSIDEGEARRRRSRSASLSGMILHRVRDSISEASREARFGFDFEFESEALGLEEERRRGSVAVRAESRPTWLARTFARLRRLGWRSPPAQAFAETESPPNVAHTLPAPHKSDLVPFPRDSPPPATPTSAAPLWPQTRTTSSFLPLHIEPFRVTYKSTYSALDQAPERPPRPQRHSLAIPPHIRPRLASKQSREMATQYSYHDFAHALASTSAAEPPAIRRRPHSESFSADSADSHTSSSCYGPTPPTRSRQGSNNTTTKGNSDQIFAFVPPPLPPTPSRFDIASLATPPPASPSPSIASSSFPLQYPSPSALTFPPDRPRSVRPSFDSVSAALGHDRSDARVLAFVEERPSPHRASPVEAVASETGSDDGIIEIVTSRRIERAEGVKVGAATPPRSSLDGGPASSLRRLMDARARKRRELAGSISSTSAFPLGHISLPNTPPTTPRHQHQPQPDRPSTPASPTSQSQSSFHTAHGTLHSRPSFGSAAIENATVYHSADVFVVPPTPTLPSATRSRTSSNHEPLSKRMSLRYELALAASASVFDRRGSASTIGSLGSGGTQEDGEGMEDYETKARRRRMSLLRKVEVRPSD